MKTIILTKQKFINKFGKEKLNYFKDANFFRTTYNYSNGEIVGVGKTTEYRLL